MVVFLHLSLGEMGEETTGDQCYPSDNMLLCSTELNITVYDKEMRKSAKKVVTFS